MHCRVASFRHGRDSQRLYMSCHAEFVMDKRSPDESGFRLDKPELNIGVDIKVSLRGAPTNPFALSLSKGQMNGRKHFLPILAVMVRSRLVGISFRFTELNIFANGLS